MSLRVRAPLPPGDVRRSRGEVMEDPYMSRMVKLVPVEAVGPFPFLMQSAEALSVNAGNRYAVYFVAWVLLLIVIVVRWQATSEPGKGAQWGAVLIAAVSFVIWVYVMKGDFGFEEVLKLGRGASSGPEGVTRSAFGDAAGSAEQTKAFISNVSLMAWSTLAPIVYKGEEGPGS